MLYSVTIFCPLNIAHGILVFALSLFFLNSNFRFEFFDSLENVKKRSLDIAVKNSRPFISQERKELGKVSLKNLHYRCNRAEHSGLFLKS